MFFLFPNYIVSKQKIPRFVFLWSPLVATKHIYFFIAVDINLKFRSLMRCDVRFNI